MTAMLDPDLTGPAPHARLRRGSGSGAMMLEYTAHAAAAEVRVLAAPVTRPDDLGGRRRRVTCLVRAARGAHDRAGFGGGRGGLVATSLVAVAVRALRLRGVEPAGTPAAELYERAAAVLDPDMEDRPLTGDVESARQLLYAR